MPVRFDPFDAGLAHAFVKGRWVRCISEHHASFAGRSEREILLATAELRRRLQRHGQQLPITARKLADFLDSLQAEEVLLEQRLRDAEARNVRHIGTCSQAPQAASLAKASGADGAGLQPSTASAPTDACLIVYEDYD